MSARKSISKKIRLKVLSKYNSHCAYCGKILDLKSLRVDHLYPLRLGGKDNIDNYMPSCQECNFYKSTHTLEAFRDNLLSLNERITKPFIVRLGLQYGIVYVKRFDGKFYFEKEVE